MCSIIDLQQSIFNLSKKTDIISVYQLRAYAEKLSGTPDVSLGKCESALLNMGASKFITSQKYWDVSCIESPYDYGDLETPNSYVYIIGDTDNDLAKIGHSVDPVNRLQKLSVANPFDLEILCLFEGKGQPFEQKLHYDFRDYHKKGEWFEVRGELRSFINDNRNTPTQ